MSMTTSRHRRTLRPVPIVDLSTPRNGLFQIYTDHYWLCDGDSVFFYGSDVRPLISPQCNRDKSIAESVYLGDHTRGWPLPDTAEVRQIPIIFVPVEIRDYT